jgi:glycosyltransferase involved in cell wall biosynthesis
LRPAVNRLWFRAGEDRWRAADLYPPADGGWRAFLALVPVPPRTPGEPLAVSARMTGRSVSAQGEVAVIETLATRTEPAPWADGDAGDAPLVAICMATYRPDPAAFGRQIASIIAQTHRRWVCIVNDDASGEPWEARMRGQCTADPRFVFRRNDRNLGFYLNFERTLRRVPAQARFVVLADQDDDWYPDKLETLIGAFDSGTELVYSDMRIVDEQGGVRSDTYWRNRRNEYRDFTALLVANTVTGAASMFRVRLLDVLVPFPPRIGDAFHDHWIACAALARGTIGYVDRPLYDYRQHGASVIGHCDFDAATTSGYLRGFLGGLLRARDRAAMRRLLGRAAGAGLAFYRYECRRIEALLATIAMREPRPRRRTVPTRLFGHGLESAWRLLWTALRFAVRGHTTDHAELRLAGGYLANWWLGWRGRRQSGSAGSVDGGGVS